MKPANNLRENINKLPEACAIYHIVTKKPVILQLGEKGYYPADYLNSADKMQAFNQAHKADAAMIAAMELGSIAGFEVPGADPDLWRTKWIKGAQKYEGIAFKPLKAEDLDPEGDAHRAMAESLAQDAEAHGADDEAAVLRG